MKRRTIKKVAKCYLDGRNVQRYLLGAREFWIDSNTSKAELVFPLCIEREILAEATGAVGTAATGTARS